MAGGVRGVALSRAMEKIAALNDLLRSCFRPDEMVAALTFLGRGEVVDEVPAVAGMAAKEWFYRVIDWLQARGELDQSLFGAIERERPGRADEVRAVAALFVTPDDAAGKLGPADLERLLEAALAAGLDAWETQFALLEQFGWERWRARLHRHASTNLRATLEALNDAAGDELERWLGAAEQVAGAGAAGEVLGWYRCHLERQRSPADPVPAASEAPAQSIEPVHDIGEYWHRTEIERLVPFSYLAAGQRAGEAVARVRFVRHVDGQALLSAACRYQGTGVLVAPRLMLTSWWLARASSFERGEEDFLAQCRAASFRFDPAGERERLLVSCGAAAWNVALNLILVRIEEGLGREHATLRAAPLQAGEPLSVIQHPLAGDKRVGLRIVREYAVPDPLLRFRTQERIAFAGAPWFDDAWRVVAIQGKVSHRGSVVEYTATPIAAIVEALRRGDVEVPPGGDAAAVWEELRAAQPELAAAPVAG